MLAVYIACMLSPIPTLTHKGLQFIQIGRCTACFLPRLTKSSMAGHICMEKHVYSILAKKDSHKRKERNQEPTKSHLATAMGMTACTIYLVAQITVHIRTLRDSNSPSTLHYLNGNCTWSEYGTTIAGEVSLGPELPLPDSVLTSVFEIKCQVNDSVRLHADVTILGELITERSCLVLHISMWHSHALRELRHRPAL